VEIWRQQKRKEAAITVKHFKNILMKRIFLLIAVTFITAAVCAQAYPEPEFSNEVSYLKKDSINIVIRLEKGSSKMESKTKMGGIGGFESGYEMDGSKSPVRINGGSHHSFIFSKGHTDMSASPSKDKDSMMRANGIDPSMMSGMSGGMNDPASGIVLYKVEQGGGKRKILLQKSAGMMPFGSKKNRSSDTYTFSVKKIKEGYWELVIDKSLPRGEYIFTVMNMGGIGSMNGETVMYGFGVD
jgi:hypothetical protein